MAEYDVVGPQTPDFPTAVKLAQWLREVKPKLDAYSASFGDVPGTPFAKVREYLPSLGDVVVGDKPEALERIGYGRRLTTGKNQTLKLAPGVDELALDVGAPLATAATKIATKAAPRAASLLREAAENAAAPVARGPRAAQRGAISWDAPPKAAPEADWTPEATLPGPAQQTLPGIKPLTREQQREMELRDIARNHDPEAINAEANAAEAQAEAAKAEAQGTRIARMLRERPGPGGSESTGSAFARESELLRLKGDAPNHVWPTGAWDRQQDTVETLRRQIRAAENSRNIKEAEGEIARLRGERTTPNDTIEDALRREGDILRFKLDTPGLNTPQEARQRQMDTVRELRRAAQFKATEMTPDPAALRPIPNWAEKLTELPTTRGIQRGGTAPAGRDWWNKQFNIEQDRPASVGAFLKAVRDVEPAFQYGTEPKGLRSLEDYADEFGKRGKERIDVEWGGSADDYDEPYKIEEKKKHGYGELMRDQYGDYKYSEDPKVHERGDYPMYDEQGNVKKKELFGPPLEDEGPLKVKRRAEYGDVKRDEYGNKKFPLAKSTGGETYRDERGRVKWTERENPDYNPPSDDEELTISTPRGKLTASNYGSGDEALMGAMEGGKSGALMYQTLYGHASKHGHKIGVSGLTPDNQLRILSNALSNAARTGVNPRDVSGTLSGARKHAVYGAEGKKNVFAEGQDIWRGETGEAERRIAEWGGDPNRVQFDGKQFLDNGQPLKPSELVERMDEIAPGFKSKGHKAGPKTVMRAAVYRWLEGATPEQAEEAAKNWGKVGGPLFGFGASGIGATLAAQLRKDAVDTEH